MSRSNGRSVLARLRDLEREVEDALIRPVTDDVRVHRFWWADCWRKGLAWLELEGITPDDDPEFELELGRFMWASPYWLRVSHWLLERGIGVAEEAPTPDPEAVDLEAIWERIDALEAAQVPDMLMAPPGIYGGETWRAELRLQLEHRGDPPNERGSRGDWKDWTPERVERVMRLALGGSDALG